jgi:hypothetical protein
MESNLRNALIACLGRGRQAAVPNTLIADRFLAALVLWAIKQDPKTEIAIPAGFVTAGELMPVLSALKLLETKPGNGRTGQSTSPNT